MCHKSCIIFGARNLNTDEVRGKDVIEVGSRDVNGSLRSILSAWGTKRYVGVDIVNGPGVDLVCSAEDITRIFGPETFDIVVSTEMIEHVRNWREAISSIKQVCKPGGTLVLTTRSIGYGYHGYPYDFWRYETEDLKRIFSDFEILALEKDSEAPGVFLKARKPKKFSEADLSSYKLYSILLKKKVLGIDDKDQRNLGFAILTVREKAKKFMFAAAKKLLRTVYPGLYYG